MAIAYNGNYDILVAVIPAKVNYDVPVTMGDYSNDQARIKVEINCPSNNPLSPGDITKFNGITFKDSQGNVLTPTYIWSDPIAQVLPAGSGKWEGTFYFDNPTGPNYNLAPDNNYEIILNNIESNLSGAETITIPNVEVGQLIHTNNPPCAPNQNVSFDITKFNNSFCGEAEWILRYQTLNVTPGCVDDMVWNFESNALCTPDTTFYDDGQFCSATNSIKRCWSIEYNGAEIFYHKLEDAYDASNFIQVINIISKCIASNRPGDPDPTEDPCFPDPFQGLVISSSDPSDCATHDGALEFEFTGSTASLPITTVLSGPPANPTSTQIVHNTYGPVSATNMQAGGYFYTCTDALGCVTTGQTALECSQPPIRVYGCMDPTALNYNPAAVADCTNNTPSGITNYGDIDCCLYCNLSVSVSSITTTAYNQSTGTISMLITDTVANSAPYQWSFANAGGNIISNGVSNSLAALNQDATISGLGVGIYTFTVTSSIGCFASEITIEIISDAPIYGCTDPSACNYDSTAQVDDSSCIYPMGCNNWCPGDPGSAIMTLDDCGECLDPSDPNYNSCEGCTDPSAINYDPNATVSCTDCCMEMTLNTDCETEEEIQLTLGTPFWDQSDFNAAIATITHSGVVFDTILLSHLDLTQQPLSLVPMVNGVATGIVNGQYCVKLELNLKATQPWAGAITVSGNSQYQFEECFVSLCDIICDLLKAAVKVSIDNCTPGAVSTFLTAYSYFVGLQNLIHCGDGSYITSIISQIESLLGTITGSNTTVCDPNCTEYDICDLISLGSQYAGQLEVYNACVDHAEEDFQLAIAIHDLLNQSTYEDCLTEDEICILKMKIHSIISQCCPPQEAPTNDCIALSSGVYNPNQSYAIGDVVMYQGVYYTANTNGQLFPPPDPKWDLCEQTQTL